MKMIILFMILQLSNFLCYTLVFGGTSKSLVMCYSSKYSELQPDKNFGGLPYYFDKNYNQKICTAEQFKERFNIFCTNNSKNDLFANIDFEVKWELQCNDSL